MRTPPAVIEAGMRAMYRDGATPPPLDEARERFPEVEAILTAAYPVIVQSLADGLRLSQMASERQAANMDEAGLPTAAVVALGNANGYRLAAIQLDGVLRDSVPSVQTGEQP